MSNDFPSQRSLPPHHLLFLRTLLTKVHISVVEMGLSQWVRTLQSCSWACCLQREFAGPAFTLCKSPAHPLPNPSSILGSPCPADLQGFAMKVFRYKSLLVLQILANLVWKTSALCLKHFGYSLKGYFPSYLMCDHWRRMLVSLAAGCHISPGSHHGTGCALQAPHPLGDLALAPVWVRMVWPALRDESSLTIPCSIFDCAPLLSLLMWFCLFLQV